MGVLSLPAPDFGSQNLCHNANSSLASNAWTPYDIAMERAIEIEDLAVRFPARGGMVEALTGLSLTVPQGQVVGFLGPNGAGKTTTMHVLLGFIRASSGTARIFGRDVTSSIARERIGYLPEQPETYKFMPSQFGHSRHQ